MNTISIKFKSATETRRTSVNVPVTFAAVATTVSNLFALDAAAFKLSYVDTDGDLITFSTDHELAEAVAQLPDNAVLTVHVAATSVVAPQSGPTNIWLQLPVWVRNRVVANHLPGADVNDAAVWDRLTPDVRERVHSKFVHKFAAKQQHCGAAPCVNVTVTADEKKASDAKPEASALLDASSDQDLWAAAPSWFKNKIVAKFAPGASADDFATFAGLPEPVKMRVRCRAAKWQNCQAKWAAKKAAKEAKALAAAEPVSEEADRAMWAALPAWMRFKVAAKSAKKGVVVADVHDFATFQALPPHVQGKVRDKAAKCQKWANKWADKCADKQDGGRCGRGRGGWWRAAQTSATSSAVPQPASTFTFGQQFTN